MSYETLTRDNSWTLNSLLNSSQSGGDTPRKCPCGSAFTHQLRVREQTEEWRNFGFVYPKPTRMEAFQCWNSDPDVISHMKIVLNVTYLMWEWRWGLRLVQLHFSWNGIDFKAVAPLFHQGWLTLSSPYQSGQGSTLFHGWPPEALQKVGSTVTVTPAVGPPEVFIQMQSLILFYPNKEEDSYKWVSINVLLLPSLNHTKICLNIKNVLWKSASMWTF